MKNIIQNCVNSWLKCVNLRTRDITAILCRGRVPRGLIRRKFFQFSWQVSRNNGPILALYSPSFRRGNFRSLASNFPPPLFISRSTGLSSFYDDMYQHLRIVHPPPLLTSTNTVVAIRVNNCHSALSTPGDTFSLGSEAYGILGTALLWKPPGKWNVYVPWFINSYSALHPFFFFYRSL